MKGGHTRFPFWADRGLGAKQRRGSPRSEQESPCNQRKRAGGEKGSQRHFISEAPSVHINWLLQQNRSRTCTCGERAKVIGRNQDSPAHCWNRYMGQIGTSESTHRQTLTLLILTDSKTTGVLKVFVIRVLIFKVWWEKLKLRNLQKY